MLHNKREGAVALADGRGVVARKLRSGAGVVEVLRPGQGPGGRSIVSATWPIPGPLTALDIVGVADQIACLRVERVTSESPIRVQRRAVCVDLTSGRIVTDKPLPAPGIYLPRTELALGGAIVDVGLRLAAIHPTSAGLQIDACEVTR